MPATWAQQTALTLLTNYSYGPVVHCFMLIHVGFHYFETTFPYGARTLTRMHSYEFIRVSSYELFVRIVNTHCHE